METNIFDYIVIGAGSAGCIVAARLSEDPSVKVLLIEAGPGKGNIWTHIPIGYYKNIFNKKLTWQYETEPEPYMHNRRFNWPRGKMIGGCSANNGLIHIRGQAEDYDLWYSLNNSGWSYQDVLPYFKKLEKQERGEDGYHGVHGPIGISDMRDPRTICQAFIDAGQEIGLPYNKDFNGSIQEGVGLYQLTVWNGIRTSSADHIKEARNRPNLTISADSHVEKIIIENRCAVGVEYRLGNTLHRATAKREVVLSAGAIGSPQILQLSGVGPGKLLQNLDIDVQHDSPGVGQNLLDHFQVRSVYKCNQPITINELAHSLPRKAMAGIKYLFNKSGPLTIGAGQAAAFMRSAPEIDPPDMEIIFMGFSTDGPGKDPHDHPGFTILGYQLRPESKGSVTIVSSDPMIHPSIVPNYLSEEIDRQVTIDVLKTCRRFAQAPSLQKYVETEKKPGKDVQKDEEILDFARSEGSTVFHPTSTCRMGSDELAVVDNRLRVKGIENLRVADASIMPTMVSGNTCAAVFMIGEKAADLIKQDAKGN